ncbi:MAG: YceI family protein [Fibrobacterota bacterium]
MKILLLIISILFSFAPASEHAHRMLFQGHFSARATGHSFEGRFPTQSAQCTLRTADTDTLISLSAEVPVADISTDNPRRDKNMYAMFDKESHPVISGQVEEVPLSRLRTQNSLPVALSIRDRKNTHNGTITELNEGEDHLNFILTFPLSLDDYALEPGSPLPGVLKVHDEVNLTIQVKIETEPVQ